MPASNMPLQHFDLAIVGGGLGGLALAIQAANAGHTVALYEKENYPFHKVCGEYISMESFGFLQQLGVPLTAIGVPQICRLQISDMSGKVYLFQLPLGGFGISRYTLDFQLYQLAVQKGVRVFTNTKVADVKREEGRYQIFSSAGECSATVVAGAFGKRSNLDVKWKRPFTQQKPDKLNNYIGIKYHVRYPHSTNTIALHNFQNGYCGISAIEEGKTCLCYLTSAANLAKSGHSISAMEANILQANPQLKKIFTEAEFLYSEPLTISQVSFAPKQQVENGMLMLGDAAGMITPLCGNGMSMALHGSKLAFEAIHAFLQHQISRWQMEAQYRQQWQKHFARRLWIGRQVQRLFGERFSTALFLKTMNALPFLSRQIIKATHGKPF